MTAPIEVIAIRRLDGTSSVKAFCDIKLGGVTIKGAKIVQQPEQRPWLAMPAVKTNHGWSNTIELSPDLRQRVTAVAIEAWQEHQKRVLPERGQRTWDRSRETRPGHYAAWSQPPEETPFFDDADAASTDPEGRDQ